MEAVAAKAGVSKITVYNHFGDKKTLFEHYVMSISDRMLAALGAPDNAAAGLRERLMATGRVFLETIFGPVAPSIHFLTPAFRENASLEKRFYDAGPGRTRTALIAIINEYASCGELVVDNAEWAADDLIGLWDGGLPAKVLFAIVDLFRPEQIERRAARAVNIFLRIYQLPRSVTP